MTKSFQKNDLERRGGNRPGSINNKCEVPCNGELKHNVMGSRSFVVTLCEIIKEMRKLQFFDNNQ